MKENKVKYPALVALMASRGETQESLGEVMHLSKSAISRRLTGEVEWSLGEVKTICTYYGKSYYDIFESQSEDTREDREY